MEPVIRGATTADIEQPIEMRRPSDEIVPFYRRHGFEVPADPLIREPTEP